MDYEVRQLTVPKMHEFLDTTKRTYFSSSNTRLVYSDLRIDYKTQTLRLR